MNSEYYNTPVPNKQINSAGEIVNPADYYGPNGLKVDLSGGSVEAQEEFVFANAVTTAGSKQYTAAGKKDVVITFLGPGSAIFTAKLISYGVALPIQGVRKTGVIDIVDTAKSGEMVEFEKPAGSILEISWTAPTGGAVSAKATVS
ncbi:hypothetical protein [Paenibacillus sp. Marseille-Q4541]|uniref:hypothetical protein n=1 Tax=Paenibacillus sp. Marseille-Q4541 TaxID=2831522 RepID=UPI001BA74373|nr:hypothetical protein [Paenibacillus sp. Marseille-Q4541]